MNILITGAKGFIGKNLVSELREQGYTDLMEVDHHIDLSLLEEYCRKADFVYHLAGINRPKDSSDFMEGNYGFTNTLVNLLNDSNNNCPIVYSSSIQAESDNPYGKSKRAGEKLLLEYSKASNARVFVYRLPNVFGKWCKPNYNSVVATFCHNIARGMPIHIDNPEAIMKLVYIDDVIDELIRAIKGSEKREGKFCKIPKIYNITLDEIATMIYSFKNSRDNLTVPNMSNSLIKKLYSTYLSYLPKESFRYELEMKADNRGSFTEFLKTAQQGQVSVNISKPGVVKGNHWHRTKNEKFLVVYGTGMIRFRKIYEEEIIEYYVSGDKLEVVDIPIGYTHNIENIGNIDMVTMIWVNECYNPKNPDTYYLKV